MTKNVLLVVYSAPEFAGVQRYILNLAVYLKQTDYHPRVWMNQNTDFTQHLTEETIEYEEYTGHILLPKNIRALIRCCRRITPTILHAHMGKAAIAVAMVKAKVKPVQLVYTQHFVNPASSQGNLMKRWLFGKIYRYVFSKYDCLIAISNEVKQKMLDRREADRGRIHCVHTGIRGISEQSDYQQGQLLVVSRLEKEKGVAELLPIMKQLKDNGYTFKLTIAGSGNEEKRIRNDIAQLSLEDVVELVGQVNDVTPYYIQAAVLLNPTQIEGFGLTIVEAMSAGLPVIAFNQGGPKDIVIHGETGFLVKRYEEFFDAIKAYIEDPDLAKKMGEKGKQRFQENFTLEVMGKSILDLYMMETES